MSKSRPIMEKAVAISNDGTIIYNDGSEIGVIKIIRKAIKSLPSDDDASRRKLKTALNELLKEI